MNTELRKLGVATKVDEPEPKRARIETSPESTDASLNEAKVAFAKGVNIRCKHLASGDLLERKQKLEEANRDGKPEFSWRMPGHHISERELLAFLRSDDQGPTLLQVSGGIQNARRVASLYNGLKAIA